RKKGRTRDQLYEEAKSMGIEGRSKMTKEQVQRAANRRKETWPRRLSSDREAADARSRCALGRRPRAHGCDRRRAARIARDRADRPVHAPRHRRATGDSEAPS